MQLSLLEVLRIRAEKGTVIEPTGVNQNVNE